MSRTRRVKWVVVSVLVFAAACAAVFLVAAPDLSASVDLPPPEAATAQATAPGDYIIIGWNDLGMHCYNRGFANLAILPPYNTLWAQVIRVGDPPQVVTSGIQVSYFFTDNTYSVGKSNFWDYVQPLFGVQLPPNVGLKGKGLSGYMDREADHFIAEGIPLTEFRDSAPTVPYPYQTATIVAYDANTQQELARLIVDAPVSTEMHCEYCHYDGGVEGISTGNVEWNILTLHDDENQEEYPPGHTGPLMDQRPVLCADCHQTNALNLPGVAGIPNFSAAMHETHAEVVPPSMVGCYFCHPGPQTKCLRGTMFQKGLTCIDCHGTASQVAQNPSPWLHEPRCDATQCHGSAYAQNAALYRMSSGHGGMYCEACHDSTHAIAPSVEYNDQIKFLALQGHTGTLSNCTVCHATMPTGPGPHGILAPETTATPTPTTPAATATATATAQPTATPTPTEPHGEYRIFFPILFVD